MGNQASGACAAPSALLPTRIGEATAQEPMYELDDVRFRVQAGRNVDPV